MPLTPFVFAAGAGSLVAWTAYVGGVLLVIAGLWNLSNPAGQFVEWAELVIGVLLFIAPWVLGFSAPTAMAWSAWLAGIVAVLLAGSELFADRNRHALAAQR